MPEGHTIHRLAKFHNRILRGHKLAVTSPQGRFAGDAKRVTGHLLKTITAHGKHLFYRFDNDLSVHIHLGMHGSFRTLPMPAKGKPLPDAVGQVRMRLVGGPKIVELTGPTACETIDEKGVQKIRDRLGPDVLDPAADAEIVWDKICKRRTPIGLLLMDQSVVSGIGNVYRAEILYRQKVHPLTPGLSIDRKTFDRIWTDGVELLAIGLKLGHIVTVDGADIGKPIAKATREDRFLIYRRPTCRRCGTKVMQFTVGGRDCFVCPREQKPPHGVKIVEVEMTPVAEKKPRSRVRDHGDAEQE